MSYDGTDFEIKYTKAALAKLTAARVTTVGVGISNNGLYPFFDRYNF